MDGPAHLAACSARRCPTSRRPARAAAHGRPTTRTRAAPPTPSRSTRAPASAPASAPRTARTRCGCSPTPHTDAADLVATRPRAPAAGPAPAECCNAPGHTEAAVDLCRLAGLAPVGRHRRARARRRRDDAAAARSSSSAPSTTCRSSPSPQLIDWRQRHDRGRARGADPAAHRHTACSTCVGYRDLVDRREHVALVSRDLGARRTGAAGAAALRVPHRRRVRLAALRLRPPAGAVAGAGSRPRAASWSTCADTRAGHRAAQQAPGLRAAGPRPRHRRRQTSSSACPSTRASTARAQPILADLGIPVVRLLTNNPMKVDAHARATASTSRRSSGCRFSALRRQPAPTCAPSATGMGHDLPRSHATGTRRPNGERHPA